MSYFGWKNNPVDSLHAKDDPSLPATETDFIEWKDGAERSREAVGAGYISKMIVFFENDPTVVPTFANVGVPVDVHGKVDDKSVQFNCTVIALATLCGKNFQHLYYMNVEADLWKAVSSLRQDSLQGTSFQCVLEQRFDCHASSASGDHRMEAS
eukprot:464754-Rhodomonas_salina.3